MKQANQNIIIDETTMEFSQSVLSASLSDSLPSDNSLTARWGETENQEETDNEAQDTATNDQEDNKEVESDSDEDYNEYLYYKSRHENKKETDSNTEDNTEIEPSEQPATVSIPNPELSVNEAFTSDERQDEDDQSDILNKEDDKFFADLEAYEETSSDEEDKSDTEEDNREHFVAIIDGVRYLQYHTATPLPIIEPLPL